MHIKMHSQIVLHKKISYNLCIKFGDQIWLRRNTTLTPFRLCAMLAMKRSEVLSG